MHMHWYLLRSMINQISDYLIPFTSLNFPKLCDSYLKQYSNNHVYIKSFYIYILKTTIPNTSPTTPFSIKPDHPILAQV